MRLATAAALHVIAADFDASPPFDAPDDLADALGAFEDEDELPCDFPVDLAEAFAPIDEEETVFAVSASAPPLAAGDDIEADEVDTGSEDPPLELVAEIDPGADEAPPFDPPDMVQAGFHAVPPPTFAEALNDPDCAALFAAEPAACPAPPTCAALPPAPPIVIRAFWDRPRSAALMAAFAADPRLARAKISVERGGLDGAVLHCSEAGAPDLLIVDSDLRGRDLLAGLEKLQPVLGAGTKLILLGAVNDISLLRALAARGVTEYIVPPLAPAHLVQSVCGLYAEQDNARVIAVIGARGGVGASTLARNIAWSIAERQQQSAALLDLDFAFGAPWRGGGTAPTLSDILPTPGEIDVAALDRAITKQSARFDIVSARTALAPALEPDLYAVDSMIGRVRRTSPFVVLDVPHAWNAWVRNVLTTADDVVIVASPDLAALRNADNILKLLQAVRKMEGAPLVVMSMTGMAKRPQIPAKEFAAALGMAPAASIAFEPEVFVTAEMSGQTLFELAPSSKAAAIVDALASALTGYPVAPKRVEATQRPLAPLSAPEPMPLAEAPAQAESVDAAMESVDAREADTVVPELAVSPPATVLDLTEASQTLDDFVERARAAALSDFLALQREATDFGRAPKRGRVGASLAALALVGVAFAVDVYRAAPLTPVAAASTAPVRRATGEPDAAFTLLRRAAEAGSAPAQYRLAKAYERGEGIAVDAGAARLWTERAAGAGNVRAMHDLGVYFARGDGAEHDEAAAFRWFRQAAEFDVADSQYNLGILYEQGRGVGANQAEALFWFMLAARQGDEAAAARVGALSERLSPMDVEQARARTEAFRPRAPNPLANAGA